MAHQIENERARQDVEKLLADEDQHPHRRRPIEEVQPTRPGDDTFHEYSAGSDALPWVGWYENVDGETTAWVDLAGRVHVRIETSGPLPELILARRNAAWNAIRDSVRAADQLPLEPEKTDYWPSLTASCLLSLAMKELHRKPKGESQSGPGWVAKDRRRRALRKLEEVFAALEILRPEKGAGEKARLEDAENDDWYSDGDTR